MQTEGKLGQQARKMVIVNGKFEYDKLNQVKDIEGGKRHHVKLHLLAGGDGQPDVSEGRKVEEEHENNSKQMDFSEMKLEI